MTQKVNNKKFINFPEVQSSIIVKIKKSIVKFSFLAHFLENFFEYCYWSLVLFNLRYNILAETSQKFTAVAAVAFVSIPAVYSNRPRVMLFPFLTRLHIVYYVVK